MVVALMVEVFFRRLEDVDEDEDGDEEDADVAGGADDGAVGERGARNEDLYVGLRWKERGRGREQGGREGRKEGLNEKRACRDNPLA